jgi:large subunit ribosomal protein L6
MSRVGNKVINIPAGVTVNVENNTIVVKGPKGELSYTFNADIKVEVVGAEIKVTRPSEEKTHRALHGTTRANIQNMVTGVSEGYEKVLEIVGTGYRAQLQGDTLVVNGGYSHPVNMKLPEGITVVCPSQVEIHITGCDKQVVGEFAAEIRKIRKPEPYLGKGIHYRGEFIRRKEGKKAK